VYFVENFLAVGMPDVAFWFQVRLKGVSSTVAGSGSHRTLGDGLEGAS
jgi:hypothetical protein